MTLALIGKKDLVLEGSTTKIEGHTQVAGKQITSTSKVPQCHSSGCSVLKSNCGMATGLMDLGSLSVVHHLSFKVVEPVGLNLPCYIDL